MSDGQARRDLEDIADQWIDAFNREDLSAEDKVDNLLRLYNNNAVHYSPRLITSDNPEGKIQGKDKLREWWLATFKEKPNLRYQKVDFYYSKGDELMVIMHYIKKLPGEPDIDITESLKVENRLIVESRVYIGNPIIK